MLTNESNAWIRRKQTWGLKAGIIQQHSAILPRVSGDTYPVSVLLIGLLWSILFQNRCIFVICTEMWRGWHWPWDSEDPWNLFLREKPDSLLSNVCFYPIFSPLHIFFSGKGFIPGLIQTIWWNYFSPIPT